MVYLKDGMPEGDIDEGVKARLKKYSLFSEGSPGSERTLNYCGFVVYSDSIVVSLPKALIPPETDDLAVCKVLYKTLLKYGKTNSPSIGTPITITDEYSEDLARLSYFQIYDELLEDWSRFGVYKNRIKDVKIGFAGRVDWKKTTRNIVPYHDQRLIPIYPKFYTNTRNLRLETLVSDIHRWCVAKADKAIGWLKSAEGSTLLFPNLRHWCDSLPCDRITGIYFLKKELHRQYDQRKIRLLKMMIWLLDEPEADINRDGIRFGVRFFWPIWEAMCRNYLADQSDSHYESIPQPRYLKENDERFYHSSNIRQRPDILIGEKDGNFAIIDAKYYDVSKNVPGWQDIVKQFFYAASFEAIKYAPEINNILLFPQPPGMEKPPTKIIMKEPQAVAESGQFDKDLFGKIFPPIECRYLAMTAAMKSYVKDEQDVTARDAFLTNALNPSCA